MPKVIGKSIKETVPYKQIMLTEERAERLQKIAQTSKYWQASDALRFCVDFTYRELIEKANDERRC